MKSPGAGRNWELGIREGVGAGAPTIFLWGMCADEFEKPVRIEKLPAPARVGEQGGTTGTRRRWGRLTAAVAIDSIEKCVAPFEKGAPRRGGGTNPGLNRAAEERQCPETGQPVIHEVLDDPEYVYLRFHAYR